MEMNRYLIAALYVMAGCVVTVPLKAQGNVEPLRGERYRLIITSTVKVLSNYVENEENESLTLGLTSEFVCFADPASFEVSVFYPYRTVPEVNIPCSPSNRIRAPGMN